MIFFRQNLHEVITLPKPPIDDLAEAYKVAEIIRVRTPEQVQSVQDHDQEPYYAIRKVCEKNNLEFHDGEFKQIIKESVSIIKHFKDLFDRKRPTEVLSSLNTLSSVTNKTRSYPSGHATQSVIIARYVAGKVPRLERELMKAAYECGYGRVIAGFHYPSDYEAGNLLGEKMYVLMNKMDYGQEVKEEKVSFKDFLKN
jgi:acid phosphatase (class A)